MGWKFVIVRYSEIFLKSDFVRNQLTKRLSLNIKNGIKREGINAKVKRLRDVILIETNETKKTTKLLRHIFGIVSFSPAIKIQLDEIEDFFKKNSEKLINGKFAVRVSRKGKHEFTSNELAAKIGEIISNTIKAKVNLKKPDTEIFLDVRDQEVYIYKQKIKGPGGIPIPSQGKINCYIDSREDLIACWLMMKRGCRPIVFFRDYPTDVLDKWSYGIKIERIKVNGIQDTPEGPIVVGINLEKDGFTKLKEAGSRFITPVISFTREEMDKIWERIKT
ncbi:MAG: THUMP domain-containing protein [Candidatus Aenigmatarchaeota archaeon]